MRRNGVLAGLARRAAEVLAALLLSAAPALAGDRALIDFLGYSPDGKYFAFEEFGIQDGSGFAYSSIHLIDLVADKWVDGSPFRAQASEAEPETPLAEIRADAQRQAAEKLKPLGIGSPVDILALLGDGVPDHDGKSMLFSIPACCGPGDTQPQRYSLELSTFPATSDPDCEALTGQKPLGYALALDSGTGTVELHRDGGKIPRSRGCTMDYRLYAVLQPFDADKGARLAVISTYPFGFEGPDRRFLVVPIDRP